MIDWQAFNIDLGRGAGRTSGYVKTYCPHCHENGKPKSDHSLSCNVETGAFKCHRCGYQGYATVTTDEEKEAWIEPIKNAPLFNGRRQSGFICRLAKEERMLAKAIRQEMEKEEELPENAKVVESSAQGDADMGEFYQFGIRFYYDEKGEMVQVPLGAPARPTKTAVWVNDPEGWYEPEDIPERESEF